MALQKVLTTEQGLDLPQAYLKVRGVSIRGNGKKASFVVDVYKDAAARDAGKTPVDTLTVDAPANFEDALIALVYNRLKTVAEFTDAQDV